MKVVIFAGGYGTRISEESHIRPKPMIEIGGRPILWHIMKIYSTFGFNDFVILGGYRCADIKNYFLNYHPFQSDLRIDISNGSVEYFGTQHNEQWSVTVLDTGLDTMTGGRLLRARPFLAGSENFLLTYGDGVGDIDIPRLVEFHTDNGLVTTLTAVTPPGRFGIIDLDGPRVRSFEEKSRPIDHHVNAGFFVVNSKIFDLLEDDATVFERRPLETLSRNGQLGGFRHDGFWHPMDTLRDKNYLEDLWSSGKAPWKIW